MTTGGRYFLWELLASVGFSFLLGFGQLGNSAVIVMGGIGEVSTVCPRLLLSRANGIASFFGDLRALKHGKHAAQLLATLCLIGTQHGGRNVDFSFRIHGMSLKKTKPHISADCLNFKIIRK